MTTQGRKHRTDVISNVVAERALLKQRNAVLAGLQDLHAFGTVDRDDRARFVMNLQLAFLAGRSQAAATVATRPEGPARRAGRCRDVVSRGRSPLVGVGGLVDSGGPAAISTRPITTAGSGPAAAPGVPAGSGRVETGARHDPVAGPDAVPGAAGRAKPTPGMAALLFAPSATLPGTAANAKDPTSVTSRPVDLLGVTTVRAQPASAAAAPLAALTGLTMTPHVRAMVKVSGEAATELPLIHRTGWRPWARSDARSGSSIGTVGRRELLRTPISCGRPPALAGGR